MIVINSTKVSFFTLAAYVDTGSLTFLYFSITLCAFILIISANLLLVVVISVNRSLHKPMYLFLCSLFVNEVFGSTGLFPFLLVQILSDSHHVSVSYCFLQIFCAYSYVTVEFTNLAVISYDRYLAICFPLQYNVYMTSARVAVLVAVVWLPPFLVVFATTFLTASLKLCGNIINKVYCNNYSIIKLSCFDTRVNNLFDLIAGTITILCPLFIILYTYIKILKVCYSGSKQTRQKAVSTCTPHLASLLNFSSGISFQLLENRFSLNALPYILRMFVAFYFVSCQPLFNPLIYGLNMSEIRVRCQNIFINSFRKFRIFNSGSAH